MRLTLESFGYDYAPPPESADYVADVRDIPSSSVDGIEPLDGRTKAVQEAVMATSQAKAHRRAFLDRLPDLPDGALCAFGCSHGVHRSVALVEVLADELRQDGHDVTVRHRDLGKRDTGNNLTAMRPWYEIRNAADPEVAQVYIYDQVGEDFFGGGVTAKAFVAELQAITAPAIELHVNSPGGSVFDGVAIHNALLRHPATVTTYVDGLAASIASVIALAGERIVMASNALFMIHLPSGAVRGTAADMRQMADVLDKVRDTIVSTYQERTGASRDQLVAAMTGETWYTAEEALAAGFIDEVGVEQAIAASFDLEALGFQHVPQNAGRVLSGANEQRIRTAHDSLVEVLASLEGGQEAAAELPTDSDSGGAPDSVSTTGGAPDTAPVEAYVPGLGIIRFRKDYSHAS